MASRALGAERTTTGLLASWRRLAGLWLLGADPAEPVPAAGDTAAEALFRRSFESALVGMCLTSTDGHFLRVNSVFAELLGRPAADLVGIAFASVSHPGDLEETTAGIADMLAGRTTGFRQQKRYLRPDGSVVYVALSCALVRGADGTPLHFTTQTVDVTDRHLAEQDRDMHLGMLRSVIANSQSLIYVKDLYGCYLLANEPFERAVGVSEAELLGKDATYLDPILGPAWMANDQRARSGEYRTDEWSDGPDGLRVYESVKLPLLDGHGQVYATCGISLDVTDRRKALEEMQAASQAIHDAALAATEANDVKSRFLATMSHEIRTPMHAVIGMTGLLLDTALDPSQRQFVEIIRRSGEALLITINDVLDFSRLGEGGIQMEERRFNLVECLDETLAFFATEANDLDLRVDHGDGCPTYVLGDPHRLRQVLVNLVGNAVKFTEQGHVSLGVSLPPGSGAADGSRIPLTFTVRDTGIGIPADAMDRLFGSFSQVDPSTTRVYGGSGLGLAISRAIVQKMGGDISVTSNVGVGSTFSFTVSLGRSQARHGDTHLSGGQPDLVGSRARAAAAGQAGCRALRVLLAEDNLVNQQVAELMVRKLGHLIDIAGNGRQAVDALQQARFDVVLMDIHMPVMDGLEATRAIRAQDGARQPWIIAMTASNSAEDEGSCMRAGMDDYLSKPVRMAELVRALARVGERTPGEAAVAVPGSP